MILLDDRLEHIDEARLQPLLQQLPAWRREQALRYRHLAGQRECAVSFLLLCRLLLENYGITEPPHFSIGEHGKPTLAEHPHLHFNLSHCRCAAICAVGENPVGVDIERVRPVRDDLLRYTMNSDEAHTIMTSPRPDIAFTQYWTRKEAVCKLLGTGINHSLQNVLQEAEESGIIVHTIVDDNHRYAYSTAVFH